MTLLVNLTPHNVNVIDYGTIPSSGQVARVSVEKTDSGFIDVTCPHCVNGCEHCSNQLAIPVKISTSKFGKVEGLPDPQPGVLFIVSRLVLQACPERTDLVAPGDLVRDENGNVIGCNGLSR